MLGFRKYSIEITIFISLFFTYAYFYHLEPGWNVNSRLALTYAIVDKASFYINDYHDRPPCITQDKAYYKGHYFSDKIIGVSLLGTIPYAATKAIFWPIGRQPSPVAKRYVTRLFSVSLLAALAGVIMFKLLLLFGATTTGALLLVYAFSLCTLIFPYATLYYQYGPVVFFTLCSYWILLKYRLNGAIDKAPLFAAGLFLGLALLCDYLAAIVAIGLTIYLFLCLKEKPRLAWFILGIIPPLALFVTYSIICFGTPTIPYKYEVKDIFQLGMAKGFMGITYPKLKVLYYLTIHPYRGLFFSSPFLLLSFLGLVSMWQVQKFRPDVLLFAFFIISYFLLNSSYYMWWGGWAMGPRHLIPMLPFMIPPLIWVLRHDKWVRIILIVLLGLSLFFIFIPAAVEPQIGQGYPTEILLQPKVSYNLISPMLVEAIPAFFEGKVAFNVGKVVGLEGQSSLLPLSIFWILIIVQLYLLVRKPEITNSRR